MHDAADNWVLSGQLKLVLLQRIIQGQDVCVQGIHVMVNHLELEAHADFIHLHVGITLVKSEHDLNQHKRTFDNVTILLLLARGRQGRDLLQNFFKVLHEDLRLLFLVFIQMNQLLKWTNQMEFGFKLQGRRFKAHKQALNVF